MTLLIIDVGSSSARAMLFERDDQDVQLLPDATAQGQYQFDTGQPGQATFEPVFLRQQVEAQIDEILQHPAAANIEAVGMDTFVGNLLLLQGDEPCSPLYTYADTQNASVVPQLAEKVDVAATHQRTGCLLHTAYAPSRIHWLQQTQPGLMNNTTHLSDFNTYCYKMWFGRDVPTSYSIASWSGLLNREHDAWDQIWLDALGLQPDQLPQLADYSTPQRGLAASYAERWPQLRDVPFYLAVGDGAAAQVGSGAVTDDTLALTVGTTAALRRVSTDQLPPVPDGLWSYRIDATQHLLGGALSEGGNIFQWAMQTLQLDAETIEADLAERAPGVHNLTVLPTIAGERSPGWWSGATGTVTGLRMRTTPMDICHALLEAVALRIALVARQLGVNKETRIMASGGALHASSAWAALIATAIGQPLHVLDEPEITGLGVAQLLHCALKEQTLTNATPRIKRVVQPEAEHVGQMNELIAAQEELYDVMRELHEGA